MPRLVSRRLLVPGLTTLVGVVVLIALGVWQLERMAWKRDLITTLRERLVAAPEPLPPRAEWGTLARERDEFRRVRLTGTFDHAQEGLVYSLGSAGRGSSTGLGYLVFTPLRLADGGTVLVDRGFVPDERKDAAARPESRTDAPVEVIGLLRWSERRPVFAPSDDPARNLFFARDVASIATAKGLIVAPFYVDLEIPVVAGGPRPLRLDPNLPDNHLQYALTWFALAIALAIVFALWARGRVRDGVVSNP